MCHGPDVMYTHMQIDHSTTVIAEAQVAVDDARAQLPGLVQQGVARRLSSVLREGGGDASVLAVESVAQLIPVVP